ncbi:hypothetical protein L218DRAFT_941088 [Marasmius fiardii PR-910]|nr:hypothetical protein L218DRAFT_941088 [Marasmius fiardii PR-910]
MSGKTVDPVLQSTRSKHERKEYYYGAPKKSKICPDGCPVGTVFQDRQSLRKAMVHGPIQAGIHGSIKDGTYSVVISGGYEDDEDHGDWFWYTGEGGRSAAGKQIKNQSWKDKGNKSLKMSTYPPRRPVRVIRGYIPKSPYAPAEGLRYDGLYRVMAVRTARGKSGHLICKAYFKRLPNQAPLPPPRWPVIPQSDEADGTSSGCSRSNSSDSEKGSVSGPEVEEEEETDSGSESVSVAKSSNSGGFHTNAANMNALPRKRQRSEHYSDSGVMQNPQESAVDPTCTLPEKADLFSAKRRKYQNLPKIAKKSFL